VNGIFTTKDARRAYREILQGYSYIEEDDIYVKHFTESDLGYLEILYKKCEKELQELGIESSKEKLKFLKESGYWTEDEENAYINAKYGVEDALSFKDKLTDPTQKKDFEKHLEEREELLKKVKETRDEVLNPTTESFCDRRINEHYVRIALFKDKSFTTPCFAEEEFRDLSYVQLGDLVQKYNKVINVFDELNIKRIAVNGFFLNAFLMSENDPVKFYGKSVLELTMYQINLFSKGKYYKSILEEGKDPPDIVYSQTEEYGLDPIVNWFDTAWAQIQSERARRNTQAKAAARRR
jgi:hypothetical protein